MQIEIIYLATFGMIFLGFVFTRHKMSNFIKKGNFSPYKTVLGKEGRSLQT